MRPSALDVSVCWDPTPPPPSCSVPRAQACLSCINASSLSTFCLDLAMGLGMAGPRKQEERGRSIGSCKSLSPRPWLGGPHFAATFSGFCSLFPPLGPKPCRWHYPALTAWGSALSLVSFLKFCLHLWQFPLLNFPQITSF